MINEQLPQLFLKDLLVYISCCYVASYSGNFLRLPPLSQFVTLQISVSQTSFTYYIHNVYLIREACVLLLSVFFNRLLFLSYFHLFLSSNIHETWALICYVLLI